LIVVGKQVHAAQADRRIGGSAPDTVNRARCPVPVVRPVDHDFTEEP
jgi:hypothetical protein